MNRVRAMVLWAGVFALLASLLHADVVSMKDGSVLECKIVEQTIKNGEQVMVLQFEGGKRRTIKAADVAWIAKAKVSWEIRKDEKSWYAKEVERKAKKLESSWKENERLGKNCKRKRFLDAESEKHFQKAYELRKPEIKDTVKDHEKFAKWLEKTCGMFGKAGEEWLWVFDKKIEDTKAKGSLTEKTWYTLGKWAEGKNLYDKAKECYSKALEIKPDYKTAQKGIERIKRLQETLVNPKLFRTIRDEHDKAAAFLEGKQNKDGSYGADVKVAGIQAHRAITALSVLAILGKWEFAAVDGNAGAVPKELTTGLDWFLKQNPAPTKLRGPDLWGNIFGMHMMVRVLMNNNLERYHSKVKSKFKECSGALASMQGSHGGWAYYSKNKNKENSFTGSALLIVLAMAKKIGVTVDSRLFDRGLAHLKKTKQQDGVWMYKSGVKQSIQGSQGRAAGCELALVMCGAGSLQAIQISADNFFKYRNILEAVKGKKGTHMGSGGTAPYYYLWGHFYLSMALQYMDAGSRDKYMGKLRDLFLKDQESDGSFIDWPLTKPYKIYGAALGAVTLYHIGTVVKKGGAKRR